MAGKNYSGTTPDLLLRNKNEEGALDLTYAQCVSLTEVTSTCEEEADILPMESSHSKSPTSPQLSNQNIDISGNVTPAAQEIQDEERINIDSEKLRNFNHMEFNRIIPILDTKGSTHPMFFIHVLHYIHKEIEIPFLATMYYARPYFKGGAAKWANMNLHKFTNFDDFKLSFIKKFPSKERNEASSSDNLKRGMFTATYVNTPFKEPITTCSACGLPLTSNGLRLNAQMHQEVFKKLFHSGHCQSLEWPPAKHFLTISPQQAQTNLIEHVLIEARKDRFDGRISRMQRPIRRKRSRNSDIQ